MLEYPPHLKNIYKQQNRKMRKATKRTNSGTRVCNPCSRLSRKIDEGTRKKNASHCELELLLHLSQSSSYKLPLLKIKTSSQAKRNKPSLIFTCQSNVYLFKISELGSLFMLHSLDVFFYNKTLKTVWNFPWIAGGLNFTILVLKPPLQKCKIRYNQFRKL